MSSFERLAEARIREAQAEGAFDDLEGAGRPLDLDRHEGVPRELRGAFAVLEHAGYLPEELITAKRIATLADLLGAIEADADEREGLERELSAQRLRYELLMERRRRGCGATAAGRRYDAALRRRFG